MLLDVTDMHQCRRRTTALVQLEKTIPGRNGQSGAMARVANRARAVLSQECSRGSATL